MDASALEVTVRSAPSAVALAGCSRIVNVAPMIYDDDSATSRREGADEAVDGVAPAPLQLQDPAAVVVACLGLSEVSVEASVVALAVTDWDGTVALEGGAEPKAELAESSPVLVPVVSTV